MNANTQRLTLRRIAHPLRTLLGRFGLGRWLQALPDGLADSPHHDAGRQLQQYLRLPAALPHLEIFDGRDEAGLCQHPIADLQVGDLVAGTLALLLHRTQERQVEQHHYSQWVSQRYQQDHLLRLRPRLVFGSAMAPSSRRASANASSFVVTSPAARASRTLSSRRPSVGPGSICSSCIRSWPLTSLAGATRESSRRCSAK